MPNFHHFLLFFFFLVHNICFFFEKEKSLRIECRSTGGDKCNSLWSIIIRSWLTNLRKIDKEFDNLSVIRERKYLLEIFKMQKDEIIRPFSYLLVGFLTSYNVLLFLPSWELGFLLNLICILPQNKVFL